MLEKCKEVLINRQQAYADEDRLSNFKQISQLTGLPPEAVCIALQAKHCVAQAKAIKECRYHDALQYTVDLINYQFLLNALTAERLTPVAKTLNEGYIKTRSE